MIESMVKEMSLETVSREVRVPVRAGDHDTSDVDYDSENEDKLRNKPTTDIRDLVDQLHVPRARSGHPQTGAYPYHCPVLSCRKRFADSGHLYAHWKCKLHDSDRKGREKNNTEGLLTGMDNCSWSGEPDDDTVCPNCQEEKRLKVEKDKEKAADAKQSKPVVPRKKRRANQDD